MFTVHALTSFVSVDSDPTGGSPLVGGVMRWTIDRTRLPPVAV